MKKLWITMLAITMGFYSTPAAVGAEGQMSQVLSSDMHGERTYLAFHNARIQDVLRLIAEEYDLNIVMSDDVQGLVTLRLRGASLANTLDAVLLSRNYDYEIRGNIIRIAAAEVIEQERKQRLSKEKHEPLSSEIITLKYLDANDVKSTLDAMLSPRGKLQVLEQRGYKGFKFTAGSGGGSTGGSSSSSSSSSSGGVSFGDASALVGGRSGEDEKPRSSTLLIVDLPSQIERIKGVLAQVDVAPRQILIDAKILEVDTDTLEDMGMDLNQELSIATDRTTSNLLEADLNTGASNTAINGGIFANAQPAATDSGLHVTFTKLNGEDLTLVLHALLQDERTKTLSSPKILTVENQEAAILVGEQFPIFESSVTDNGTATESLSFYLPIGISLQAIAQVTPSDDIMMIIHPSVSSVGAFVTGSTGLTQPRINVREADTRVLIQNGETLVIGGLLEDVVSERNFGVPVLKSIPLLGRLFSRRQIDVDQRNLLIFITPRIVENETAVLSPSEKVIFDGLNDPDAYGFLEQRRRAIREAFKNAKRSYKEGNFDIARAQFLKIVSIDPHHKGAIKYLKKLEIPKDERNTF